LDCTFRDGGYYDNWDFPQEVVKAYVSAVNQSGIGNVEIGFRNFPDTEYRGAFYYSSDEFIKVLGFNSNVNIFVMIDALNFKDCESLKDAVNKLFPKFSCIVSGVRIATRIENLSLSIQLSNILRSLGYRVFFNLMQVAAISRNALFKAISELASSEIEVLYFADSLGEMVEHDVKNLFELAKTKWGLSILILTFVLLPIGQSLRVARSFSPKRVVPLLAS